MTTEASFGRESQRPAWAFAIASELDRVEAKLNLVVASSVEVAKDLSMHMFSAGGKRMRPALTLLSALAVNEQVNLERVIDIAAATELIHTASLVHDDVVDETSKRRGVSTANSKWGNRLSVLGGDYLLSKAFTLVANDADLEIIEILAGVAVGMSESEMLQVTAEGRIDMWEEHYWQIIKGKTAKFISACCECGAALGGASKDVRHSLAEYGMQLGIAFQITDDILDIAGNPNKTGKEIGNDLINGKYTLPVLLALPKIDSEVRETLLNAGRKGLTRSEAKRIAALVVAAGGTDMARSAAFECVQKAKSQLEVLEPSKYKDALDEIASSIVIRDV